MTTSPVCNVRRRCGVAITRRVDAARPYLRLTLTYAHALWHTAHKHLRGIRNDRRVVTRHRRRHRHRHRHRHRVMSSTSSGRPRDLRHRPLLRFSKGNIIRMRWDVKTLLSEHPGSLPEPLHGSCPRAPTYLEVKTARDSLRGVTRGLDRLGGGVGRHECTKLLGKRV